jgi:hypothetical protein
MKDAIGYLRVSTDEQGRRGLGLAAQRHDIEAFGVREGFVPSVAKRWPRTHVVPVIAPSDLHRYSNDLNTACLTGSAIRRGHTV